MNNVLYLYFFRLELVKKEEEAEEREQEEEEIFDVIAQDCHWNTVI